MEELEKALRFISWKIKQIEPGTDYHLYNALHDSANDIREVLDIMENRDGKSL